MKDAGGMAEIVAPTIGGITTAEGKKVPADQKVDGGPSVLYDAVAMIASKEGVQKLKKMHPAKGFAADAFAHAKFIAIAGEAADLFHAAGVQEFDDGVITLGSPNDCAGFVWPVALCGSGTGCPRPSRRGTLHSSGGSWSAINPVHGPADSESMSSTVDANIVTAVISHRSEILDSSTCVAA